MSSPEVAESQLTATGLEEPAAARIVSRFATQARRLSLDLKQRREERILSLKHHFENVTLEIVGLRGEALIRVLEGLLPPPAAGAAVGRDANAKASLTVNDYSPPVYQPGRGSGHPERRGNRESRPRGKEITRAGGDPRRRRAR